MDVYNAEVVRASLTTIIIGRQLETYEQVGSTNDLVREAGRRGAPEGLVILAEEQVAGRGRLGRVWSAPPCCCILSSILLRPRFSPEHAFYLTIAASLAIYRACAVLLAESKSSRCRPDSQLSTPAIKWPNDVLIGGRKVSGVLCESEFSGGAWAFSIVGFGINVNLGPEQLGGLQATATSLSIELGSAVSRVGLLSRVLSEFESLYLLLQNGQLEVVHRQWVAALETIGKRVSVQEPGGAITGQALRVDSDGALVVRADNGKEKRVIAGDVLPGASET
ncbi:MAG: biotin--[acetyl-CoA-carboxylase] ligase [Chloroflexi bacterium]|nr:biotin--[acetyl-CoA-carboxylase] ligase [Chloroflexota bacterium]